MRTTAGTARRFQRRMAASRILLIAPASARRLIPTTAETVQQSQLIMVVRLIGQTAQPSARRLMRTTAGTARIKTVHTDV